MFQSPAASPKAVVFTNGVDSSRAHPPSTVLLAAALVAAFAQFTGCSSRKSSAPDTTRAPVATTALVAVAAPDASNDKPDEAPGAPTPEWQAESLSRARLLRQYGTAPGPCRLESVGMPAGKVAWSIPACVATRHQLVFASDDGERFLVVEPFPEYWDGNMLGATVAGAYERAVVQREIAASMLVGGAAEGLRATAKHFYWLTGVLGHSGKPPRLVPEGIALETLAGAAHVLGFDGRIDGRWPSESPAGDAGLRGAPPMPEDAKESEAPRPAESAPARVDADGPPTRPAAPAPSQADSPPDPAAAAEARRAERERWESAWKNAFREINDRIAGLESSLSQAKQTLRTVQRETPSSWQAEFARRHPMPRPEDPNISVPVGRDEDGCLEYSGGERVCGSPPMAGDYEHLSLVQIDLAQAMEESQRRVDELESQLAAARQELDELDRRASYAAVPRELRH